MKDSLFGLFGALFLSLFLGNFTAPEFQDKEQRSKIRRVKRPEFKKDEWKDIYFEDLFAGGLVGSRPKPVKPTGVANNNKANSQVLEAAGNSAIWSRTISRDAIENEIKSVHRQLQTLGTTPGRFNSQFDDVRQQFSMLSLMFGIIHEYEQDVRWKKSARGAQKIFSDAVVKARTPSKPGFENSKLRKEDLAELVRGGSLSLQADSSPKLVWSNVVERQPVMIRLEKAFRETLKPASASKEELQKRTDEVIQQSNVIAALAQVLIQEGMDSADDDGYMEFSKTMGTAARQLITALGNQDFDLAAKTVNKIEQSCDDCHGEWR